MLREEYREMNQYITPSKQLRQETIDKLEQEAGKRRSYLRPLIASLGCLLVIMLTIPVLAAEVPAFQKILYNIAPKLAEYLQPIQLYSDSEGIRLTVRGAAYYKDSAVIYFDIQDLTGERLSSETYLDDLKVGKYAPNLASHYTSPYYCEQIGYDAKTKTASYVVLFEELYGNELKDKKIFLRSNEIKNDTRLTISGEWNIIFEMTFAEQDAIVKEFIYNGEKIIIEISSLGVQFEISKESADFELAMFPEVIVETDEGEEVYHCHNAVIDQEKGFYRYMGDSLTDVRKVRRVKINDKVVDCYRTSDE